MKKPIAPGFYNAKPTNWGIKTVGQKNSLCAFVDLVIEDGEHVGTTFRYDGYLTEKTLEKTLGYLRAAGFDDDSLERFNQGAFAGALQTETTVRIKIEEESYNGKTYRKVKGIYSAASKQKSVDSASLPEIKGAMMALRLEAKTPANAKVQSDDLAF